jgi:hypothetical protein
MKYVFETDELYEAKQYTHAIDALCALQDIVDELRGYYKYEEKVTIDTYEFRQRVFDIMEENHINLEELLC